MTNKDDETLEIDKNMHKEKNDQKNNLKNTTIKIEDIKKEIQESPSIIEVGEKKEIVSLREKTKVFFNDLRIRFKNLFSSEKKIKYLPEYYDLPYKYNKNTVKILAQTPHKLFVYWDFDDKMKEEITNKYGEHFWEKTYPVLIVKNVSRNYSFELQIDDFANSWYIDIPDNSSVYSVEIGRKLKENFEYNPKIEFEILKNKYVDKNLKLDKNTLTRELLEQKFIDENKDFDYNSPLISFKKDEFFHFGSSNEIISPNGHILLDSLQNKIKFMNIDSGDIYEMELRKRALVSQLYDNYDSDIYSEGERSRSSWLTSSGLAFERNV